MTLPQLTNPEKLKELHGLFLEEARKYDVLPLDATIATRLLAPRPNITASRSEFTYTRPMTGIPTGRFTTVAELFLYHHRRYRRYRRAEPKA